MQLDYIVSPQVQVETCKDADEKVLWAEHIYPGSRAIKQIELQKNKQMAFCDLWIAVCQKDNEGDVKQAVGHENYVLRDSGFRNFIQNIRTSNQRNINRTSEVTEASEASF